MSTRQNPLYPQHKFWQALSKLNTPLVNVIIKCILEKLILIICNKYFYCFHTLYREYSYAIHFILFKLQLYTKSFYIGYLIVFQLKLSMMGAVLLTVASLILTPPPRYPDLFPVLVSIYSCAHFVLFLAAFHYFQFQSPSQSANVKKVQ